MRLGLRIAIWHNLPSGGGMRACHDQIRGLVARGHHIEVWCPSTADRTFLPLNELVSEHVHPFHWKPLSSRSGFRGLLKPYYELSAKLAAMEEHCLACAKEITQGGFDLCLAHPCMYFRASPIAKYVNIPTCLYLQEPYRWLYEAFPKLPWVAPAAAKGRPSLRYVKDYLKDLIVTQAFRLQVRDELAWVSTFNRLLVNSYFSRESVLRAYNLDSRVCYLGVDTDMFQPVAHSKEHYVIGLGNIYDNKGIALAVEAIGTIEESKRPALIWVGNFAEPEYLAKVHTLSQTLKVQFTPKILVSDEELIRLLGSAAVMVYTSRLEPFGYAPLEANACGTAVVAVAEGGVRETVQPGLNGRLAANADPNALGAMIQYYTDDLDVAQQEGQQARSFVERSWTINSSIDRLEEQLSKVCGYGLSTKLMNF